MWFDNAIFPAIDWNLEEDVDFVHTTVDPEMQRLWTFQDSLRTQLEAVNEQMQTIEFEKF